ncbi:MAG: Type IV pilus assembly protein PilM [Candidatus Moranbacteria bacterium GW2011_GWC2_37_8]|nr:MAG: Type IV pilus assembly protein PilM [Candidatus Moranbacteria bacterium GW2011_GWC2_37_8]KKQ62494.1 MAG: Type IV pilus assembly protein PilM [Parcubacteria group bacterium GW2011_GWC1_38_22]KKQ81072.1 MAG: Type IV pilus assembly protein PilM [Candidatus Moranbacteria bacterium GW2011_GWD2_38_7]
MLEFLKGKKNHFIGIDFGTSSIKVVEISYQNQKLHLENYGVVDLNWSNHGDEKANMKAASFEQKLNESLKSLLLKMNLSSGMAYVSIPGFSGLITIIELPEMESEELAKAIKFEAHKYIPSSLDEIAMSWEIIEHAEKDAGAALNAGKSSAFGKKIKVLLVAAPKRDIERYDRLVSGSMLDVGAIELETFSIARSLVGDDNGSFFIIDIGSRATNIILVENGVVKVNRNIDAGGNEITNAICDSMNISRQRAEIFKKGDKDFLNTTETSIVIPVLELIVGESLRIMNAYKEKNKDSKITSAMLSGGTATMKGLDQYFSRSLGVDVTIGDPWKKVAVEPAIKPLADDLGCSFAVALGLAMRGVEDYKRG